MTYTLVPVYEHKWTNDYSYLRTLTCRNHTTATYYTKNPWERHLHVIALPKGDIERTATRECTCPFGDLVVVTVDGSDMLTGHDIPEDGWDGIVQYDIRSAYPDIPPGVSPEDMGWLEEKTKDTETHTCITKERDGYCHDK